jgi:hypothetical protein
MTDQGDDVTRAEDPRPGDPGAEHGSGLQKYRTRIEEWAFALRDGAEQHAPPEMLSGLAGTVRNVAQFLDGMAERARAKQANQEVAAAPTDQVPGAAEPTPKPTEQAESPSKD